jgi:transposase
MISMRPMFHYTDDSIRVHVFICLLSLLLLSLLRLELSRHEIHLSYLEALNKLKKIGITRIFDRKGALKFEKLNQMGAFSKRLFNIFKLKKYL